MKYNGLLITFEGGEGAGKTTHTELFKNYLTEQGYEFFATREPGGTDFSEAVRALTKDMRYGDKSILSELFLFESARADIVEKKIIPALEQGKIVIMDRFYDSTTVYQSFGRGINRADVEKLNQVATQGLVPDLTYYLRIDKNRAFERKGGKDKNDLMEMSGDSFHQKIQLGFDTLAQENPDRYVIINTDRPVNVVYNEIITIFNEKIANKQKR